MNFQDFDYKKNPVAQLRVGPGDHHPTLGGVTESDCCPVCVLVSLNLMEKVTLVFFFN